MKHCNIFFSQIVYAYILFWGGFAKFEPSLVRRKFSTSVLNGLHDLHDTSTFGYYGSQIIVVTE